MIQVLKNGDRIQSPGGSYTYEIIGEVCRLYDRETLDYPHCRIEWKDSRGNGKAPSWNRIGKRFVPDMATKIHPSYSVQIVGTTKTFVVTLYHVRLTEEAEKWWHSKTPYLRIHQGQEDSLAA